MNQIKNRNRCAVALFATIVVVALLPVSAPAATGGASGFGGFGSESAGKTGGSGIAFTGWKGSRASWYGPGLYGRQTACGQTLRPKTLGVAHKRLPCGTRVKFRYRGKVVIARVIDRGPYVRGLSWDLTEAASEALDFESVGVDRVRYALPKKVARKLRRSKRQRQRQISRRD